MEQQGDIGSEVVGREEELASIERFVDGHDFPRVLVLEGEAGIGKTTLWRAGVVTAERVGYRVVASRPAGAEVRLSFAALSDLLEGHLEEMLPALPGPQRRALEVVLLLADDGGRPPDERAIAVAVLNGVRALAREAPLLVAIDDAQWLDVPSASAIEYTARRLRAEQIAMLVSSRTEIAPSPPLDLERAFAQDRFTRIQVGPLSLGAIHRVVTEGAGISVNRPTLLRIHETSGGNPFYARELARTLVAGTHRTGEPLAISASLNELLGNRLSQFSDPTADALAVAAAASEPTLELVGAVLDAPAAEVLEPAVRAGVVRVTGGRIEFTHPLLASAAYAVSGERDRRHWHARLADSSADLEERARHRALAAAGPDADVAALLHEAGRQAWSRGAPAAAAELLEHAIALTPDDEPQLRAVRTVDAAATLVDVGDRERARSLLEGALPTINPGPVRGDALLLLSDLVEDDVDGADRQLALIEQSLLEPGADDRRRAEALLKRELHMRSQDHLREALEASRKALTFAEATDDEQLRVRALSRVLALEVVLGVAPDAKSHFRRALALEQRRPIDPYMGPPAMLALSLIRNGECDDARPLLLRQYRRANEEGNEYARGYLCFHLAELEWLAGHWEDALRHCREGIEIAEQIDSRLLYGTILGVLGLTEASRGEVAEARLHATDGIELCESIGERAYAIQARRTLGFLDLSLGDAEAAREHLSGFSVERGVEGSKRITFIADAIEALVLLGKLDRAAALVDELERRADELHRPSLVALAGRCRGLLSGARGDPEGATATLHRAIEEFRTLNLPFERGRTLLVLGLTQRRAKRKRPAREALEEALAIFESLGAPLWAKKARSEVARIGGRRTARGLTPTERRVAELVAAGHSNKQVAAELFVSVRAVEANLTRIYAKLGIRSRTELGARL